MPATTPAPDAAAPPPGAGSPWEVLGVFLRLGVTSFGGPVAHLGYFRTELVQRRRWVDDATYADLVALCQFLPGPASSQVGFGIGLHRAGPGGAVAAFVGFTLPSAVLMLAVAAGASLTGTVGDGALAGLKTVAVAIVAHAVLGMARVLTPDARRVAIAVVAAAVSLVVVGSVGQVAAIVLGALIGAVACRADPASPTPAARFPVSRRAGIVCLAVFAALLVGGPLLVRATGSGAVAVFDAFYRAGALVFGGGHVVVPLLHAEVVTTGWVTSTDFLAGYGAAQAVPGPMFSVAALLGAVSTTGPGGVGGALVALAGIFLPGLLLLVGVLPFWGSLRRRVRVRAAMRGVGAAVVGILAAALYSPVAITAITGPATLGLAVVCFALLVAKAPPWAVVAVGALAGIGLAGLEGA